MSLTFAQAYYIVSLAAGIRPDKGETFRSRLKQWQKMGFPEGTKVGKGVKASYGALQILQLVLLVKLLRIGLTPERAQNVIKVGWPAFKGGFVEALICMANAENHLHYFMIQIDALSDLTSPNGSDHVHTFIDVFTDIELLMSWDEPGEDWSEEDKRQHAYSSFLVKNRMAISISLEIDSLLVWIWAGLNGLDKGPEIFADEFTAWEAECRANPDYRHQNSQQHFDEDNHNTSIALRSKDFDRVTAARKSLRVANNVDT